jgi:hypothetical protein
MQCLFVRSNTILLASCTHKLSLLSLIQAEKKIVELCSNQSEGRNFHPNSFLTQFAARLITQRWVDLELWFFRDYTRPIGVYHIQRALRLAKPNQRYKPANLVSILLHSPQLFDWRYGLLIIARPYLFLWHTQDTISSHLRSPSCKKDCATNKVSRARMLNPFQNARSIKRIRNGARFPGKAVYHKTLFSSCSKIAQTNRL